MYERGANDCSTCGRTISTLDFEMVIEQLKNYVTTAGKIQATGRTMHCGVHKLNCSVWTKKELLNSGCSQSLYLCI